MVFSVSFHLSGCFLLGMDVYSISCIVVVDV